MGRISEIYFSSVAAYEDFLYRSTSLRQISGVHVFFTNDANCKEVLDQYATVAYGYDTFTTFGLGIMLTSRQTVLSGPVFCRQHGTADMMQS